MKSWTNVFFPSCPVLIEGRELPTDLVLLDVIGFDVILGMDWLAQYYAGNGLVSPVLC